MKSKAAPPPPDFAARYLALHREGLRQREMCAEFSVGFRVLKRWKRESNLPFLRHHVRVELPSELECRARALGYSGLAALLADNAQHGREYVANLLGANPDAVTKAAKRAGIKVYYPSTPAQREARRRVMAAINAKRNNSAHPWRK